MALDIQALLVTLYFEYKLLSIQGETLRNMLCFSKSVNLEKDFSDYHQQHLIMIVGLCLK